jgi:hypothetical protein
MVRDAVSFELERVRFYDAHFLRDEKRILLAGGIQKGSDQSVPCAQLIQWSVDDGIMWRHERRRYQPYSAVTSFDDMSQAVVIGSTGELYCVDIQSGRLADCIWAGTGFCSVAAIPRTTNVACAVSDRGKHCVRILALRECKIVHEVHVGIGADVVPTCVCVSSNGMFLGIAKSVIRDRRISTAVDVVEIENWSKKHTVAFDHDSYQIALSPCGELVYSAGSVGNRSTIIRAMVDRSQSSDLLVTNTLDTGAWSISAHPSMPFVVVGCDDGAVWVLNSADLTPITHPISLGTSGGFVKAVLSTSGNLLACADTGTMDRPGMVVVIATSNLQSFGV